METTKVVLKCWRVEEPLTQVSSCSKVKEAGTGQVQKHHLKLHGFVNLRQINPPFTGRIGIKINKAVIQSAASRILSNKVKLT